MSREPTIDLSMLIENLKTLEGFSSTVYKDSAAVKTIGYGFTQPKYVNKGKITMEQADKILRDMVVDYYEKTCIILDGLGYHDMKLYELVALTDFAYNLGITKIRQLTNNGKRSKKEICSAIALYNKCTVNGKLKTLSGLTKRRKWEQELFNNKYRKFKY